MIFGTYNGPSYGTFDYRDGMEAFSSETAAKESLRRRYCFGYDVVRRVEFDMDGYATLLEGERVATPATTIEDFIDLYCGVKNDIDGEWIIDDHPYARLYFGPRGGVRKENF